MKIRIQWRRFVVYALYILAITFLQFFWPTAWSVWGIKPDWQLVLVICVGYLFSLYDGLVLGLILGCFRDALSGRIAGLGMFMLFACGVLASVIFRRALSRNLISLFLVLVVLTTATEWLIFMIQLAYVRGLYTSPLALSAFDLIAKRLLPQNLLNVVAAIPVYIALHHIGPYAKRLQMSQALRIEPGGLYGD